MSEQERAYHAAREKFGDDAPKVDIAWTYFKAGWEAFRMVAADEARKTAGRRELGRSLTLEAAARIEGIR